jgi:hypothetical protein
VAALRGTSAVGLSLLPSQAAIRARLPASPPNRLQKMGPLLASPFFGVQLFYFCGGVVEDGLVLVGGAVSGVAVPGVAFASGVTPGVASGVGLGVLQGVDEADPPLAHGGCVPGVVLALLDPAAPGVAAVPGEVSVPGAVLFTVPGLVGGAVLGVAVDGVDCPGVVACGDVLIPLVLPFGPGLEAPGWALCAAVPVA